MSLLPGQILPPGTPLGTVQSDGTVRIDHNWWLLLYNVCAQVLGIGSGLSANALISLESTDADAIDADAIALRQPVTNIALQTGFDPVVGIDDLPDLQRALLLAQDGLPQDVPPQAQPVVPITPGASPYTYTASFDGTVAVTGGTVSAIALIRQGTTVATGLITGLIPLSRSDSLQITYSGMPTMTFIPR